MNIIDFFIGAILVNAMPHFIFGITKTKFLGLFGYSPKGNIAYAILQFAVCILLFGVKHEFSKVLENGFFIGGLTVLFLYFLFGKSLLKVFNRDKNK